MKKLTVIERAAILIDELKSRPKGWAVFINDKELGKFLLAKKIIHKDTYKFTGGMTLTKQWQTLRQDFRAYEQSQNSSIWKDPKEPFEDWFYRKMGVKKPE